MLNSRTASFPVLLKQNLLLPCRSLAILPFGFLLPPLSLAKDRRAHKVLARHTLHSPAAHYWIILLWPHSYQPLMLLCFHTLLTAFISPLSRMAASPQLGRTCPALCFPAVPCCHSLQQCCWLAPRPHRHPSGCWSMSVAQVQLLQSVAENCVATTFCSGNCMLQDVEFA